MIRKTTAFTVGVCDVCDEPIIYRTIDGTPPVCPFCGAKGREETRYDEAINLKQRKVSARTSRRGTQRMFVNGVEVDLGRF